MDFLAEEYFARQLAGNESLTLTQKMLVRDAKTARFLEELGLLWVDVFFMNPEKLFEVVSEQGVTGWEDKGSDSLSSINMMSIMEKAKRGLINFHDALIKVASGQTKLYLREALRTAEVLEIRLENHELLTQTLQVIESKPIKSLHVRSRDNRITAPGQIGEGRTALIVRLWGR